MLNLLVVIFLLAATAFFAAAEFALVKARGFRIEVRLIRVVRLPC